MIFVLVFDDMYSVDKHSSKRRLSSSPQSGGCVEEQVAWLNNQGPCSRMKFTRREALIGANSPP